MENDNERVMGEYPEHGRPKFDADRDRFLREFLANMDPEKWTKHGDHHYGRRTIDGVRIQYWPSRKRAQIGNGKTRRLRGACDFKKLEMK